MMDRNMSVSRACSEKITYQQQPRVNPTFSRQVTDKELNVGMGNLLLIPRFLNTIDK
jgi:hypothetical protein